MKPNQAALIGLLALTTGCAASSVSLAPRTSPPTRTILALQDLRPEVEILWGPEGTKHVDALGLLTRRLRSGHWAYFHHCSEALRGKAGMADAAEHERLIAFEPIGNEPDEYGEELRSRVDEAMTFLRRKIECVT